MPALRQRMTIGTAGHVDHGKSTLVQALTGINPDRLAEEQSRNMTIDLGFAWLSLPSGRSVSIVDVPGHERFIKNMLAGVGGIDAALLIVAADEGPMPQTDEHLAILDLLGIEHGIIVLTKTDLVDEDWRGYVEEEVRERVAGTVMANAPIVSVAAPTGQGLAELIGEIEALFDRVPPSAGGQRPRLPVDRVFSVAGFGTVVTGTLLGGSFHVGQSVRIEPTGRESRIRGLESHKEQLDEVGPGARVAVNLGGVALADIKRGDVITLPGMITPTDRIDARLKLLPGAPVSLEQNSLVDFFVGATELPARITLLDADKLARGQTGWVQVRFSSPIAILKGDRFIIRRPSPSVTIGGGEIVDANPPRHKRFRPEVIAALETMAAGTAEEIVLHILEERPRTYRELLTEAEQSYPEEQITEAVRTLLESQAIVALGAGNEVNHDWRQSGVYLATGPAWGARREQLQQLLADFHHAHPLRRGLPRLEAMKQLGIVTPHLFDAMIGAATREGIVRDDGATIRRPDFQITLPTEARIKADAYITQLRQRPFTPPSPREAGLDPETVAALVDRGEVVNVGENVVFDPEAYAQIVRGTIQLIQSHGSVNLAQFRDAFATSRKYAQVVLEYLDRQKITRRIGDEHVLGPAASSAPDRRQLSRQGDVE